MFVARAAYLILIGAIAASIAAQSSVARGSATPDLVLPFPAGQRWLANGPHADNGLSGTRAFVDLGRQRGSGDGTVLAAMSGTVRNRSCVDHRGVAHKYAEVTNGPWTTRYRHLKRFTARDGSHVSAGQEIGTTGGDLNTQNSCGWGTFSHVHFGLLYNGTPYSLDGVSIGGYTIHAGRGQYSGWWTRNSDGKRVLTIGSDGNAVCCIANDQSLAQIGLGKILRVADTHTSYYFDGALHWIPDGETYYCLVARGKSVMDVAHQSEVDHLGNGKPWVKACFDPQRVLDHVVRESSSGASYYVSHDGVWHWIPDTSTYQCLVGEGHPVINSNWTQINSIRHEGAHATCPAGPLITGVSGNVGSPGGPPFPITVSYRDANCSVVGGTWTDQAGVPHNFTAGRGNCADGVGSLVPGNGSCTSPTGQPSKPGSYPQTIVLRDAGGKTSPPFTFSIVCR